MDIHMEMKLVVKNNDGVCVVCIPVVAIKEAREGMKKDDDKRKREQKREEKEHNEKRKRDKQLAEKLAKIESSKKLEKARGTKDRNVRMHHREVEAKKQTKDTTHEAQQPTDLPACYEYAAFLSHKKHHTKHADASETMAIRLKDMLKWRDINAFMDCDDLSTISKEKLSMAIAKSCCVVMYSTCLPPAIVYIFFHDSSSFSMTKLYLQNGAVLR
jgi:hypothetical protein